MEEKQKPKSVKRYASLIRVFSGGNPEDSSEYLESLIEFDRNGNTVRETKYLQDGGAEEISTYTYDAANRLVEHALEYVPDEASEKRVLERDSEGKILRETKFYSGMAGEHTDYAYEEDRVTQISTYDEEGDFQTREEIKYNEKKQLQSRIVYNPAKEIQERKEYTLADDGLSIEESTYDKEGTLVKTSLTHLNSDKQETATVEKTGQGKLISAIQSLYDERGNLVERRVKDYFSKRFLYTYDELNRCTGEEMYDEHGNLMRRQQFEFDEAGRLLTEQSYEMDVTRGGRDKHLSVRYEYELYDAG